MTTLSVHLGSIASSPTPPPAASETTSTTTPPPPTTTKTSVVVVSALTSQDFTIARKSRVSSSLDGLEVVIRDSDLDNNNNAMSGSGIIYDPMELSGWVNLLKPGAHVTVRVVMSSSSTTTTAAITNDDDEDDDEPKENHHPNNNNNKNKNSDDDVKSLLQPVHTSFLLAGLTGGSERWDAASSCRIVSAIRPSSIRSVESAPLKSRNKIRKNDGNNNNKNIHNKSDDTKATSMSSSPSPIVLMNLDDDDDDMDDAGLIDEDDLLTEMEGKGFLSAPPAMREGASAGTADDCGGRQACENCTCGRAERESQKQPQSRPQQQQQQQEGGHGRRAIPSSACGNCSKGDAFRCAGCPFLGKPAFKAGEEHLVLDLTDDL